MCMLILKIFIISSEHRNINNFIGKGYKIRINIRDFETLCVGRNLIAIEKVAFHCDLFADKLQLVSTVQIVRDPPPCRIMSYTLRDRCDETNRADEATVRQVVREISARARSFPQPSFDALH